MPATDLTATGGAGRLRVATLNLFGRQGAWDERRPVLAAGLRELAPDVIAFQEAVVTDGYDQAADLLGQGYHLVHQRGRAGDGSGASVASRWPPAAVHELELHVSQRLDPAHGWIGSLAIVEVFVPNRIGRLLVVHHKPSWQWGYELERERQAVAAARAVEEAVAGSGAHVVVAGDFDAAPDAASIRFWCGRQSLDGTSVCYRDAWESAHPGDPGHTFTPENPLVAGGEMPLERGRRIDYVLVRCGDHGPTLDVATCRRLFDRPVGGVWASDHFGVAADLVVPAGAGGGAAGTPPPDA